MFKLIRRKIVDKIRAMTKNPQETIEHCRFLTTTTRGFYSSIKSVSCPVLMTNVIFNSMGFHHLRYKADGTPRNVSAIIYKLNLLPLAIPVIRNAVGIDEERNDIVICINPRKKNKKFIRGKTLALVAKVGKKNPVPVRVIIFLRYSTGEYIFYSIMKD